MAITFDEILKVIRVLFGEVAIGDDGIELERPIGLRDGSRISWIKRGEITAAIDRINSAFSADDAFLTWKEECEVMVVDNGRAGSFIAGPAFRDGLTLESRDENSLTFSLGAPSLAYALYMLHRIYEAESSGGRRHSVFRRMRDRLRMRMNRVAETVEGRDATLAEVISSLFPNYTIRIESTHERSDYRALCESFLFTLSYNYDNSFLMASGIESIFRASRIERVRRVKDGEIDAPRMTYKSDLVHHYQLAVSAESPLLAYLSFYHVAEHFFEKVYNDDLIDQVRLKIADPAFSLKRSRDVGGVIKVITNAQKKTRDEGGVDEQKALALVLRRFVKLTKLVDDLDEYDPHIVQHYRSTAASFSDANTVDLRGAQVDEVISSLAKRIYKTRNSLVHAKDGARPKYFPFTNDEELAREVPLMRFCAEQIIISDGRII
ncbi:hypothetical protein ACIA8I_26595 [Streptomyces rishiriensis]|uniref:hypothetical protein n=1 Tax=Streptomyces rishiriensis TaxID=68264 RepID=UPI00378DD90C